MCASSDCSGESTHICADWPQQSFIKCENGKLHDDTVWLIFGLYCNSENFVRNKAKELFAMLKLTSCA